MDDELNKYGRPMHMQEKPELKKIISKLNKINIRGWKARGLLNSATTQTPILCAELGGLLFEVDKTRFKKLVGESFRYTLGIKMHHCGTLAKYEEKGVEQEIIRDFYENTYKDLKNLREKEFTERLNSFLANSEQSISHPDIKKVIAELEKLETYNWRKQESPYVSSRFTAETHGLIFTLGTDTAYPFIRGIKYKYLDIENKEEDFLIIYGSEHKESPEEQEIIRLYEKIGKALKASCEQEFKERIDYTLSDQEGDKK